MTTNYERLSEIDIIRGITILLVVCSHVGMPNDINGFLTNFRMPLFFLVSGYLFSSKYLSNFNGLINKRTYSLLLPYFSACTMFLIFSFLLSFITGNEFDLQKSILGILMGNGEGLSKINATPLWFLVCLFCTNILFWCVLKVFRKRKIWMQAVMFILIGLLGFTISRFYHLPWGFDIALVAMPFLFLGIKLKDYQVLTKMKFINGITIILIVGFIINYKINNSIDMNHRSYNNIILFYVGGIIGSLLVFKLTKLMSRSKPVTKIFSYIGKNSLPILIFHSYSGTLIYVLLTRILKVESSLNWVIIAVGGVCISLFINWIIKKIPLFNFLFNGIKLKRAREEIQKSA